MTSLSLSGVWLEGTLPHPPGTEVDLDLTLGEEVVKVRGSVVGRVADIGMAVRFVGLGPAARLSLKRYLRG